MAAFSPIHIYSILPGIKPFDGIRDVNYFVDEIDKAKKDFAIPNETTASLAVRALEASSTAEMWYYLEKEKGDLPNLDIWDPEPANPGDPATGVEPTAAKNGGLKKALVDSFSESKTIGACERALEEAKKQPINQRFRVWATKLEKAVYYHSLKLYPATLLTEDAKANANAMRDAQLVSYLWAGMQDHYLKELRSKRDTLLTSKNIIEAAREYEASRVFKNNQPQPQQQQQKTVQAAASSTAAAAASRVDNTGKLCTYCGIRDSHEAQGCNRRKRDGKQVGDVHPQYPIVPFKDRKKKKKGGEPQVGQQTDESRNAAVAAPTETASTAAISQQQHQQSNNGNFPVVPFQQGAIFQGFPHNQTVTYSPHDLAEYYSQVGRQ